MEIKSTKISYIGTLFKAWFKQGSSLLKVHGLDRDPVC
jgi:hypothetical protein